MKAMLVALLMASIYGCSTQPPAQQPELASTHWSDEVLDKIVGCAVLAMQHGETPKQMDEIYGECLQAVGATI